MDHKERQLLLTLVSRLAGSTFEEMDVLTLFMLLRSHGSLPGPTREFGHFLVHRERDRGQFHAFLQGESQRSIGAVEDKTTDGRAFVAWVMRQAPLYEQGTILADVNVAATSLGLPHLPAVAADDLVACLISLLQGARLVDKAGVLMGHMVAAFNDERLVLFGQMRQTPPNEVLIPVMGVPNKYEGFTAVDDRHVASVPNTAFTLLRVGGALRMHSQ